MPSIAYVDFLRPLLDTAKREGRLRPDAITAAFLSLILLLLPHLADSSLRGADPLVGASGSAHHVSTEAGDCAGVRRLVNVLEDAIGPIMERIGRR